MKESLHKKIWSRGALKMHLDPTPVPLIISKNDTKMDKDCVKIKSCRDPTSGKSDIYDFKIALFYIGNP